MKRPPVFLDRDGTVIVEREYLSDPAGVALEAGAAAGLSMLHHRGYPLIVLSNQSGVGRGFFTERDARRVNAQAAELLRREGVAVTAWYICPHAPETPCACRKPLPGLALAAARECQVELKGSFMVGDKRSDLELADAIGGTGILVTTGHGHSAIEWASARSRPVFDGLQGVAEYIISLERE